MDTKSGHKPAKPLHHHDLERTKATDLQTRQDRHSDTSGHETDTKKIQGQEDITELLAAWKGLSPAQRPAILKLIRLMGESS